MAAKRRKSNKKPPPKSVTARRGKAGPMGPAGPTGPAGPPGVAGATGAAGHDHTSEISLLKAQVDQLVKELQTQLTRIAQIQAQIDRFTGLGAESKTRRITDGAEN